MKSLCNYQSVMLIKIYIFTAELFYVTEVKYDSTSSCTTGSLCGDTWRSALHHQHQIVRWVNILWMSDVHSSIKLPETCRICAKEHWSSTGGPLWQRLQLPFAVRAPRLCNAPPEEIRLTESMTSLRSLTFIEEPFLILLEFVSHLNSSPLLSFKDFTLLSYTECVFPFFFLLKIQTSEDFLIYVLNVISTNYMDLCEVSLFLFRSYYCSWTKMSVPIRNSNSIWAENRHDIYIYIYKDMNT